MKYVYMIKNVENGKVYIGSSQCPEYRIQKHMYKLRTHRHAVEDFQSDFDRYGEDAFTVRILGEYGESEHREWIRMEVFFMKMFRSQERDKGYNYKDRIGTSQRAIQTRWREPTVLWNFPQSQWGRMKANWAKTG